jgi:hypothetical protein
MPQWQGGNLAAYHFGAELLAWLAPPASGPVAEVKVGMPTNEALSLEDGIVGRSALLAQLRAAETVIAEHAPDKLVILGGDCLVAGIPIGKMSIADVVRLLTDVAKVADVVGLGITEHLPWDALALKQMLQKLPLIGDGV